MRVRLPPIEQRSADVAGYLRRYLQVRQIWAGLWRGKKLFNQKSSDRFRRLMCLSVTYEWRFKNNSWQSRSVLDSLLQTYISPSLGFLIVRNSFGPLGKWKKVLHVLYERRLQFLSETRLYCQVKCRNCMGCSHWRPHVSLLWKQGLATVRKVGGWDHERHTKIPPPTYGPIFWNLEWAVNLLYSGWTESNQKCVLNDESHRPISIAF